MISRERARSFIQHFDRAKTPEIKARFTPLRSGQVAELRSVLLDRWSRDARRDGPEREERSARYWNSDVGRRDLEDHVVGRVVRDRHEYIPWINSVCPLEGARVLEIGCGRGASVMALAEQGADVVAIDVMPVAIDMTRARLQVLGLREVALHVMNARRDRRRLAGPAVRSDRLLRRARAHDPRREDRRSPLGVEPLAPVWIPGRGRGAGGPRYPSACLEVWVVTT